MQIFYNLSFQMAVRLTVAFILLTVSLFAKHELTCFAIFQNEAPYLREWLEFHKLQGVEHFYLYNNNSQDGFQEVLDPYLKSKEVTLTDWSFTYDDGDHAEWLSIQTGAYMDCIRRHKHDARWIAFIDIDEFLFCPNGQKLPAVLKEYSKYAGVCVNWQKFGTSHVEELLPGSLLIESLTLCSTPRDRENKFYKSIVQPCDVKTSESAHYFIYKKERYAVDTSFTKMEGKLKASNFTSDVLLDKIRINHYWTRTAKYFREERIPNRYRRRPNYTPEVQMEMAEKSNIFCDTTILQFVNPLRKALGIPPRKNAKSAAVTYNPNPSGRFGDQLLAFSHALWFSYTLGLPLFYKPFIYSDKLSMHDDPAFLRNTDFVPSSQLILHGPQDYLKFFNLLQKGKPQDGTLFVVPMYPDSAYLYDGRPQPQFTEVNWKDREFLRRLRSLITPTRPLTKLQVPKGRPTVALHYRSGLNFDKDNWQQRWPLKGPPDSFYRDALASLYKILDQPIYVFIFTDHPEPEEVRELFRSYFRKEAIEFDCRKGPNSQDQNVLEDFFSFEEFDCMIRPESNYSILASILFPYKILISPVHHVLNKEGEIIVDQILIEYGAQNGLKNPIRTILRKE